MTDMDMKLLRRSTVASPQRKLAVMYINGLGDGSNGIKHRLVRRCWEYGDVHFYHAGINWYDGKSFDDLLAEMTNSADELVEKFSRLIIIGSSAGGSLTLSTLLFYRQWFSVTAKHVNDTI